MSSTRHEPDGYACPFCALLDNRPGEAPRPSDVVAESDGAVAFVSPRWWPDNLAHVIVIPRTHVENLYEIAPVDLWAVTELVQRVAIAIRHAYGATGVSTRQHNEPDGGQDVWHLHVHVFPRYAGDGLYGARALPEFQSERDRAAFAETLRRWLAAS